MRRGYIFTALAALILACATPAQIPSMPVGQLMGSGIPAMPCTMGQVYFRVDAVPGSNLYVCTALPNVWSQAGGVGSVAAASLSLTGQVAAIPTANLVAAAPAGLYRLTGYLQTTTQSAGACTSTLTIGWTYNAAAKTQTPILLYSHAVDEGYATASASLRSAAGANITYAVSLAGANCANAVYDLYVVLDRLQ